MLFLFFFDLLLKIPILNHGTQCSMKLYNRKRFVLYITKSSIVENVKRPQLVKDSFLTKNSRNAKVPVLKECGFIISGTHRAIVPRLTLSGQRFGVGMSQPQPSKLKKILPLFYQLYWRGGVDSLLITAR